MGRDGSSLLPVCAVYSPRSDLGWAAHTVTNTVPRRDSPVLGGPEEDRGPRLGLLGPPATRERVFVGLGCRNNTRLAGLHSQEFVFSVDFLETRSPRSSCQKRSFSRGLCPWCVLAGPFLCAHCLLVAPRRLLRTLARPHDLVSPQLPP